MSSSIPTDDSSSNTTISSTLVPSWLRTSFKDSGVRAKDVPQAVGMFLLVKWSLYMGGLAACVKWQPLRRLARKPFVERKLNGLKASYPKRYAQIERKTLEMAERVSRSPYFRPLPVWLNVNPKNFVFALAENTIMYKFLFPVYVPVTLYFIGKIFIPNSRTLQRNDTLSGDPAVTFYVEEEAAAVAREEELRRSSQ